MAFTPTSRVLLLALFAALVAVAYSQEPDTFTAKLNGANEVYKNDDGNFMLVVGNKSGKVVVKLEIHKEVRWGLCRQERRREDVSIGQEG
ncbi:hypothetical protein CLOM_g20801 [Closterium sp. NIES-68]|nr:hypothetical protein CLOM_g20801 [Closterium sp. NIES-68]GJP81385.1 hypothetical protein CLOP_g11545 [Closterium sp. NIES-67]